MSRHTFFNVIKFPAGKEEQAFAAWQAVGRFMEQQDGFIGSTLFQNQRDPLMFINHGLYETEESFMACVQNEAFQALSQKLTDLGVERVAGLYNTVESFGSTD